MKMIKITLMMAVVVLMTAGVAAAQTQSTTPSWIVSKPVNKIANKKLFEDHRLGASHIMVTTTAHPNRVSAKAVHRTAQPRAEGNIPSKGYPTWTISKGIHRQSE